MWLVGFAFRRTFAASSTRDQDPEAKRPSYLTTQLPIPEAIQQSLEPPIDLVAQASFDCGCGIDSKSR